jgi:hypothetical protein
MWSTIVIFILVFAVLGLLLGFAEAYDVEIIPNLGAYTPPAIYPSIT